MVGRPHNCGEMTRCEEVQKHVFYSAQGQIVARYQSSSRSARMNKKIVNMCSMRQLTGLMPTTSVLNITDPARFPDGWRVWFGTAICWGFDASDPRVSSLKEARLSTDTIIIFTNTCCDAKK